MSNCLSFNTQLASIMEVLANAAVAEICKLVDDGYAVLQLEISRSQKENEALKRKLRMLESRKERRVAPERQVSGSGRSSGFQVCDTQNGEPGAVDRCYGSEVDACLWEDREVTPADDSRSPFMNAKEQTSPRIAQLRTTNAKEERPKSVCIKEELPDDELKAADQEDDVKITEDTPRTVAPKGKEESMKNSNSRHTVWEASEQDSLFKEEGENNSIRQQAEDKGNAGKLSRMDYEYVMYERGDAFPSHSATDEESQQPSCGFESESLAACAEAQAFSSWDKPSMLGSVHAQHGYYSEDKERDEFSLGNVPLFSSGSHMPMGESVAAKANVPNGWVSGEDLLAKPRGVRSHRRGGARGRLFICTYCGKGLACLKNLKTHQRVHTGEKPFTCAQCGKRFADSSNFKRHQSVHTGERRYSCTYCGKRFGQSGSLKVHLRAHTGQKQFICAQCGKSFISSSHLKRHLSVHVGDVVH